MSRLYTIPDQDISDLVAERIGDGLQLLKPLTQAQTVVEKRLPHGFPISSIVAPNELELPPGCRVVEVYMPTVQQLTIRDGDNLGDLALRVATQIRGIKNQLPEANAYSISPLRREYVPDQGVSEAIIGKGDEALLEEAPLKKFFELAYTYTLGLYTIEQDEE